MVALLLILFIIPTAWGVIPSDRVIAQGNEFILHLYAPTANGYEDTAYKVRSNDLIQIFHQTFNGSLIHLELLTMPRIPGQKVSISTWRVSRPSSVATYITFVFHLHTLTPDMPLHILQSDTRNQSMLDHENAEDWAFNNILARSSFNTPRALPGEEELEELDRTYVNVIPPTPTSALSPASQTGNPLLLGFDLDQQRYEEIYGMEPQDPHE